MPPDCLLPASGAAGTPGLSARISPRARRARGGTRRRQRDRGRRRLPGPSAGRAAAKSLSSRSTSHSSRSQPFAVLRGEAVVRALGAVTGEPGTRRGGRRCRPCTPRRAAASPHRAGAASRAARTRRGGSSGGGSRVHSAAFGPNAANEVCGWLLRTLPGLVLTYSAKAPMPLRRGGRRVEARHAGQVAVEPGLAEPCAWPRGRRSSDPEFPAVCVGTTMVAAGPATSRSAPSTVSAPSLHRPDAAQRAVYEQVLPGLHAERPQVGGEVCEVPYAASYDRAFRRCRHAADEPLAR